MLFEYEVSMYSNIELVSFYILKANGRKSLTPINDGEGPYSDYNSNIKQP